MIDALNLTGVAHASLALAFGLFFVIAGGAKSRRLREFSEVLEEHRLMPASLTLTAALVLSWTEIAVGLLAAMVARGGGTVLPALFLLIAYTLEMLRILASGRRVRCGCSADDEWVSGSQLVRNLALIGAGGLLLVPWGSPLTLAGEWVLALFLVPVWVIGWWFLDEWLSALRARAAFDAAED